MKSLTQRSVYNTSWWYQAWVYLWTGRKLLGMKGRKMRNGSLWKQPHRETAKAIHTMVHVNMHAALSQMLGYRSQQQLLPSRLEIGVQGAKSTVVIDRSCTCSSSEGIGISDLQDLPNRGHPYNWAEPQSKPRLTRSTENLKLVALLPRTYIRFITQTSDATY